MKSCVRPTKSRALRTFDLSYAQTIRGSSQIPLASKVPSNKSFLPKRCRAILLPRIMNRERIDMVQSAIGLIALDTPDSDSLE